MAIKRIRLLAFIGALLLLSACGGDPGMPDFPDITDVPEVTDSPYVTDTASPAEEKTNIRILAVLKGSPELNDYDWPERLYNMAVSNNPAINKKVNVSLEYIDYSHINAEKELLLDDMANGAGPDIIIGAEDIFDDDLYTMSKNGYFADLSPYMESSLNFSADEFFPCALDVGVIDDGRYFMPLSIHTFGCYLTIPYNKAMDSGIPFQDVTMEEFLNAIEMAKQFEDGDYIVRNYTIFDASLDLLGIAAYDMKEGESKALSPEFKQGLELLKKYIDSSLYVKQDAPFASSIFLEENTTTFLHAGSKFTQYPAWFGYKDPIIPGAALKDEWMYTMGFPKPNAEAPTYARPNDIIVINSNCSNIDIASEIALTGLTEQFQENYFVDINFAHSDMLAELSVPIRKKAFDMYTDFTNTAVLDRYFKWYSKYELSKEVLTPYLERTMDSYRNFIFGIDQLFVNGPALDDVIAEIINVYINGESTIDECVDSIESNIQGYFANAKRDE